MSQYSGFFDEKTYSAADFTRAFAGLLSNGVLGDSEETLQVTAYSNMTVAIKPGYGWINGCFYLNDATETLTLQTADGALNRIDRIILQLDSATQEITLKVIKGVAAASPTAPALVREGDYYDLCLANVYIAAGTTAITTAMITDTRSDDALCGGVYVRTADLLVLAGKADKSEVTAAVAEAETYTDEAIATALDTLCANNYYACPHNHRVEITASGNWTVPAGVTSVDVFLVGGGGGAYCSSSNCYSGGGGYTTMFKNIPVTAGETIAVTVGSGGAIATNGGYSQFKSSSYRANGGSYLGDGGSGGSAYFISGEYSTIVKGGKNGSNGLDAFYYDGVSRRRFGGTGQGTPTTDPYSGKMYSNGGTGAMAGSTNTGNGGGLLIDTVGFTAHAGGSGIVVIYYTI